MKEDPEKKVEGKKPGKRRGVIKRKTFIP